MDLPRRIDEPDNRNRTCWKGLSKTPSHFVFLYNGLSVGLSERYPRYTHQY